MPRKKDIKEKSPTPQDSSLAPVDATTVDGAAGIASNEEAGAAERRRSWTRSFKAVLTLRSKGATVGIRDGHDWVIGFPEDPGDATKRRLSDAGFTYRARDQKWTTFTHAPTRGAVEALAKQLKAEYGEAISVADYPVKQAVIAFDENPGPEATERLSSQGFRFRPDQTWNTDYSREAMDVAVDFVRTLPDRQRSVTG